MFASIKVKGESANPLWHHLQITTNTTIKGNWAKYLFNKRGKFVYYFKPKEEPETFKDKIEDVVYVVKLPD
jgi:glutathione peroxidase-family protein